MKWMLASRLDGGLTQKNSTGLARRAFRLCSRQSSWRPVCSCSRQGRGSSGEVQQKRGRSKLPHASFDLGDSFTSDNKPHTHTKTHARTRTHTPHYMIIKSTLFALLWIPSLPPSFSDTSGAEQRWRLFWQLSSRTVLHITGTEVPEFADSHGTLWMKRCSMQRDLVMF